MADEKDDHGTLVYFLTLVPKIRCANKMLTHKNDKNAKNVTVSTMTHILELRSKLANVKVMRRSRLGNGRDLPIGQADLNSAAVTIAERIGG